MLLANGVAESALVQMALAAVDASSTGWLSARAWIIECSRRLSEFSTTHAHVTGRVWPERSGWWRIEHWRWNRHANGNCTVALVLALLLLAFDWLKRCVLWRQHDLHGWHMHWHHLWVVWVRLLVTAMSDCVKLSAVDLLWRRSHVMWMVWMIRILTYWWSHHVMRGWRAVDHHGRSAPRRVDRSRPNQRAWQALTSNWLWRWLFAFLLLLNLWRRWHGNGRTYLTLAARATQRRRAIMAIRIMSVIMIVSILMAIYSIQLFVRSVPNFVILVAIVQRAFSVVCHVQISATGVHWKQMRENRVLWIFN